MKAIATRMFLKTNHLMFFFSYAQKVGPGFPYIFEKVERKPSKIGDFEILVALLWPTQ